MALLLSKMTSRAFYWALRGMILVLLLAFNWFLNLVCMCHFIRHILARATFFLSFFRELLLLLTLHFWVLGKWGTLPYINYARAYAFPIILSSLALQVWIAIIRNSIVPIHLNTEWLTSESGPFQSNCSYEFLYWNRWQNACENCDYGATNANSLTSFY